MKDRAIVLGFGALTIASSLIIFAFMRLKKKQCTCINTVKNKVVVITGANQGIGFEAALQLAFYGARIYLCCRKKELAENAVAKLKKKSRNNSIYFITLDLCSLASCWKCVSLLLLRESKIDIIIHNAGIFHANPNLTQDGFEIHYQTNFLGPVFLTEKLLPLLIESSSPRVIFTTSEAHKFASLDDIKEANFQKVPLLTHFDDHVKHYGTTKLALKLYSGYLALINKDSPFTVCSVNPGNVWTSIYRTCWNRWFHWPQRLLCSLFMKTPQEGAQGLIHAATARDLHTGSFIEDCNETFPFTSTEETNFGNKLFGEIFTLLNIT